MMADKQIVNIVPTTSPPTLRRHTPKPAPEGEINRGKGMPRNASRCCKIRYDVPFDSFEAEDVMESIQTNSQFLDDEFFISLEERVYE
ncbi:hypothetical protein TNCV_1602491 [Trichonephila clavipes]|nr:hypothetical protein TNCV_1602491 [Trichonephila clavipes]